MARQNGRRGREISADQVGLDGAGPPREATVYCGFCGSELERSAAPITRFGEPFCSEGHAEAFVSEVRAARAAAAATEEAAVTTGADRAAPENATQAHAAGRWDLKRTLKMAICCGAPVLALVFLAGGGGALLGGFAAILPTLALLACPLGMFFMMRAMSHRGRSDGDSSGPSARGSTDERKR